MRLNQSSHHQRSQLKTTSSQASKQGQSQNQNPARDKGLPIAHVMSTEQRKVLEEIQKTKSLLKQGAAASLGLPFQSSVTPTTNNHFNNIAPAAFGDVHLMSPLQRTAMQTLQQANASSFGSFVCTDSHFGNGILPVLPRLTDPNANPKSEVKPTSKTNEL